MRHRILTKAFEVMNVRWVRFTMAELARELGVSKTTIYQYFESKEELVAAIMDVLFEDVRQQRTVIINNPELDVLEKVSGMLAVAPRVFGPINDRLIDEFRRHFPKEWSKVAAFQEQEWQKIENIIRKEVDAGAMRPVNLAVIRKVYFVISSGLLDYQFLVQNNLTAHDALIEFGELVAFGLKGRGNDCQRR